MRVLITAPLRQSVEVFREYQESLDKLIIPRGVEVDRYFVVNDCPEVIPYIRGTFDVFDTHDGYVKTDNDHLWNWGNLGKMFTLRQMTVQRALKQKYDAFFSVDTDLVLHPETLMDLLLANKDIVSEIFWTNDWCNAWTCDQYTAPLEEWKTPGLYRVGMTGACMLVKRKVLEMGVDYRPIPNIYQALWGEDRHFCIRAACHDVEMWVDTHHPATHLYTEKEYQEYMRRKK